MAKQQAHGTAFNALAGWRPVQVGLVGLVLAVALPVAGTLVSWGHFVHDGLSVETDGASGGISNGHWHMSLPVAVFNDTGRAITEVTVWVDAYACPEDTADSDYAGCRQVASFAQVLPMYVANGNSAHFDDSASGGLPAGAAGTRLRIQRHLQSVRDDGPAPGELREDPATPIDGEIEHSEHH